MCKRLPGLKELFGRLGYFIGSHPWFSLAVGLLLTVALCPGLAYFHTRDNVRTGYTPNGADSIRANQIYSDYYDLEGAPYGLAIVIVEKNGGSLLNRSHFDAAARLHKFLYNFTVNDDEYGQFGFGKVCSLKCNMNDAFYAVKALFDEQWHRMDAGQPPLSSIQLTWPIARVYGRQQPMFYNMAGVTVTEDGGPNPDHPFTNIKAIEHLTFWMIAGGGRTRAEKRALLRWEKGVYQRSLEPDFDPYIRFYAYGDETANDEVVASGVTTVPYFLLGVSLMFSFVLATSVASAVYYRQLNAAKLLIPFAAILGPLCGVAVALSIMSWFGNDINALMFSMTPFLVIGIGVDDAFLMMHAWYKHRPTPPGTPPVDVNHHTRAAARRLGSVFADVGPSMTITSLTNALAFGVGALVPIPQIRTFSLNTALAILVDYVLQLVAFGPVIVLTAGRGGRREDDGELTDGEKEDVCKGDTVRSDGDYVAKGRLLISQTLTAYCRLLTTRGAKALAVALLTGLCLFASAGVATMEVSFAPEKSVPVDSLLVTTFMPAINKIYTFAHDMVFLVDRPPTLRDRDDLARFMRLVEELERHPLSRGANFSLLWLRDYVPYVRRLHTDNLLAGLWETNNPRDNTTEAVAPMRWSADLNYAFLPHFGRDLRYRVWNDHHFYKYSQSENGSIELTSMTFSIIYAGMETWASRAAVIDTTRTVLLGYPEFNVTVFDFDGPLLDLILNVKSITTLAGVVTMGCMLIISFVFVPSVLNVICATLTIGSMCFGLLGSLSWWGCDLDPITMVNMLMAVGFCVDYTAHVTYHYYHQSPLITSAAHRLRVTFEAVAWPMIQAGVSSALCILPLLFYSNYIFIVFGKTVVILFISGALHGLFILPVALAALPQRFLTVKGTDGMAEGDHTAITEGKSGVPNGHDKVDETDEQSTTVLSELLPTAGSLGSVARNNVLGENPAAAKDKSDNGKVARETKHCVL